MSRVDSSDLIERRTKIGQILVALAEYYDAELTKIRLMMYVEDLIELTPEELLTVTRLYRKDPDNTKYPLPSKLLAMAHSGALTGNYVVDVDDESKVAAANIIAGVSKFGRESGKDAKEWMGTLAWEVVKGQGGWYTICTNLTKFNSSTQQAQFRDLAKAILQRTRRGLSSQQPSLPETSAMPQLDNRKGELDNNPQRLNCLVGDLAKSKEL